MPADVASTTFLLASKTGWSIEYILWEIPVSILRQFGHASMAMDGVKIRRRTTIQSSMYVDIQRELGL